MSSSQNKIIDEVKNLIKNVNEMIALHTEVMDILMKHYSYYNYKSIMNFKDKASKKVNEVLKITEQALNVVREGKKKAETMGGSGRGGRSRVKKSTVQYEIDDILTGGYWKEMKKKK
jgi:hypothetical protein